MHAASTSRPGWSGRLGYCTPCDPRAAQLHQGPHRAPQALKFLRRTPWARERVEALYIDMLRAASGSAAETDGKAPRIGPDT
ncbi:VF530 family protein [Aromatoleum toluclasticum]|uniref:VF530 family DNA-binding protein n=1 Tax=Aromatoleum toluclasticum TaxID=92003 RepID=UPI0012F76FF2|nr:VF530 family DNA-binding protein [Aromatoleum toluclasticum]MCC4115879.1 VF530 family protein [Aromatoleum toluclasticum]